MILVWLTSNSWLLPLRLKTNVIFLYSNFKTLYLHGFQLVPKSCHLLLEHSLTRLLLLPCSSTTNTWSSQHIKTAGGAGLLSLEPGRRGVVKAMHIGKCLLTRI